MKALVYHVVEHPVPQDPDRTPSKPDEPPSEGGEDEGKAGAARS